MRPLFRRAALIVAILSGAATAQEKKDAPLALLAIPPAVAPGTAARVTIRGLRLGEATEVLVLAGARAALRLPVLEKGKADVPEGEKPERAGDSRVVVELKLPADFPGPSVPLAVVTPAGTSRPVEVLLERESPIAEKEPNDGFRAAQPLARGAILAGAFQRRQDVDVYRLEGRAGERLAVEVVAGRLGGLADAAIVLYDERGEELASSDDVRDGRDPILELDLPADGTYYLAIQEAHDLGGPLHLYRLLRKT